MQILNSLADLEALATDGSGPKRFPFISAAALPEKPRPVDWLVRGYLEAGSVNLLWGEPTAGKSLLALDWAFCIAAGLDWEGCATRQRDVFLVLGEGFSGIQRRLGALSRKYSTSRPERLFIGERPANLLELSESVSVADSVREASKAPGICVIDTLNRNFAGDENSSADIAQFIGNLDICFRPMGCAVLVVHHSGHGDQRRARGSSALRGAVDSEWSLSKSDSGTVTLVCHKPKDFEPPAPRAFEIEQVELGISDDEGEPLTSVFLRGSEVKPAAAKGPKLSKRDSLIFEALNRAIEKEGIEPSAAIVANFGGFQGLMDQGRKVAHLDDWRELAYPHLDCESADARRKAFNRARTVLYESGRVANFDGYWWPIFNRDKTGQSGTLSRPDPGQDGTHSFRSVPVCPGRWPDGHGPELTAEDLEKGSYVTPVTEGKT